MHHTTHQTVAETFTNSLCRNIGHDWKPTTVPDYRVCQRDKCHAAQRFHQGCWINAATRSAKNHTLSLSTEQATMTWAGPESS